MNETPVIQIDEAAQKYRIDVKRLRGYIFRNSLLDPIGDTVLGLVYDDWRLQRLAPQQ